MLTRREWLFGSALAFPLRLPFRSRIQTLSAANTDLFAATERRLGGRLGVTVVDPNRGVRVAYRANERFPMCSTFKVLAVAEVLARVDHGAERLERFIPYGREDALDYAPITRAHVGKGGMTLNALCEAAMRYSDDTAANLILASLGGPAGLTAYLRTLGDSVTRLDRTEPSLNSALPGDARDTTTPRAMVQDLRTFLVEAGARSSTSQDRLVNWMIASTTGEGMPRAGLRPAWRVADKTGTGGHGTTNDLAIAWLLGRGPVLIAAYFTESAALADVGRAVTAN